MSDRTLLQRINDPSSRADPYPLFAELRETPVHRQSDGIYVVGTHREVTALLHDPRVSSDPRNRPDDVADQLPVRPFILEDGIVHDRLRRLTMRHFGPPATPNLVAEQEAPIQALIDDLVAGLEGRTRIDVVEDFAYPLPVKVICNLLGVPPEDEPKFHVWADNMVKSVGAADQEGTEELLKLQGETRVALFMYLQELIAEHRRHPNASMLSGLANDTSDDRMNDVELTATGILVFIAGHETTVNLITNGMLTLLRNPDVLAQVRESDDLFIPLVEELLRFEPPIHQLPQRSTTADIDIAGTTIPGGSRLVLVLAAANRDPDRFPDPDRFDPLRPNNQHFGFGGGIHYCFGAPLARLEVQLALRALVHRLQNPSLTEDPPPYRPSPILRGPSRLEVDIDAVSA
jgi:cytochrome P450